MNEQRWKDSKNGKFALGSHDIGVDENGKVLQGADRILPETLPENPHPVQK